MQAGGAPFTGAAGGAGAAAERAPLVTLPLHESLLAARDRGERTLAASVDLGRSETTLWVDGQGWGCGSLRYPFLANCRARTIYHWAGCEFVPVSRYGNALIKLVPTEWGPPTFEIDGIKMLPTARVSPLEDARAKVAWTRPQGAAVLDTCGGLGYFAACAIEQGAGHVRSYEKNPDVLWLREVNPWSPRACPRLELLHDDVTGAVRALPTGAFDVVLHDPPRIGIAGELYGAEFYGQLARVLRPGGRLFHYTGAPNRLTSGRDVANEVANRLQREGFRTERSPDGVRAVRTRAKNV